MSALAKHIFLQDNSGKKDNLALQSNLIECLITILSDEGSMITDKVRGEVQDIYEAMSQTLIKSYWKNTLI